MRALDIGCGSAKTPGAVGIDLDPISQADLLHDLNQYPWPLASDAFDRIICSHIIEHVANIPRFMQEVHRVGVPGARVRVTTPHFSNRYSYTDPTHVHHLGIRTLECFTLPPTRKPTILMRAFETQHPLPDFGSHSRFRSIGASLHMARPFRLLGVQRLANRFSDFYELYLAFILPARDMTIDLEIVK